MLVDNDLYTKVTAFLHLESDLLDNKEYQDWLQLWDGQGLYIVPVDHSVTDYKNHLNVAYDDVDMMKMRIERLTGGEAVSTQISQNTVRTISRIRVLAENDDVVEVRASYCLHENNKNGIRTFPATLLFTLKKQSDGFKLMQKVIKIMKSDEHLTTISYLF